VLTQRSGSISGNSVAYGDGGTSTNGGTPGGNGAALGSGLFITGNETVTLAPAAGTTLAIGDTVAGAGGGYSGAGALLIDGLGTVSLSGSNSFTGGVTIASGILSLGTIPSAPGR
jgi:autotransporter-associated beta strand protein